MSVHAKLMQARLNLQGMSLKKSGHNKFAGYNYFELADFLPACQAIFHELGLCGVVSYGTDLATLTITDIESGSVIVITSPMSSAALKGCHEVQNLGAVETYIRRYLWVTAMEIVEHDALDSTTGKGQPRQGKGTISATDGALESLSPGLQEDAKEDAENIVKYWEEGNHEEAANIVAAIQGRDDPAAQEYLVAVWGVLKPYSSIRSGLNKILKERKANDQV